MIVIRTDWNGASRETTETQTTDALRVASAWARTEDIIRVDEHCLFGKASETVLYFEGGVEQQAIADRLRERFPDSEVAFL